MSKFRSTGIKLIPAKKIKLKIFTRFEMKELRENEVFASSLDLLY